MRGMLGRRECFYRNCRNASPAACSAVMEARQEAFPAARQSVRFSCKQRQAATNCRCRSPAGIHSCNPTWSLTKLRVGAPIAIAR